MNMTRNFIDLFVLRGKDGSLHHLRIASLVILTLAATLLALGAYRSISAGLNTNPATGTTLLSENPELVLARRSAGIPLEEPEMGTLAVNPELKYANRYREAATQPMNARFMASNPELGLHQRFIYLSEQATGIAFQHENPEVKLHQRRVEKTRESQAMEFLATNPEINTVHRYEESRK
jgi:hypothetical protein